MAGRRYYWLKLKEDFFRQKPMKKLRTMERGEIYTIVYLKMQLESLSNNGIIVFEGVGDSFSEELAFQIDEREEDVRVTVEFLIRHGLLIQLSETENFLPQAVENTGSEGASARRMRELRGREVSQCSDNASHHASQCDAREKREDKREKSKADKPPAPARKKYGQYGWVKLTDSDYNRLLNDLGESEVKRCIAYIDEAAQSTGNKNKWRDWNLVIRRCHRDGWGLSQQQKKDEGGGSSDPFERYF